MTKDMSDYMTAERADIEFLTVIEGFHDDLCQSSHLQGGGGLEIGDHCSIKVVAVKSTDCGNLSFRICANSYAWNLERLSKPGIICQKCGRPLRECWKVEPI